MEIKRSNNIDVNYMVGKTYIRVHGYGDGSEIAYIRIPETVKDWDEPMKSEMMEFYNNRYPLIECKICGKVFNRIRTGITCSPECSHKLAYENMTKLIECDCSVCGKTFLKRRHQQKYTCSPECTKEFGKAHSGTVDHATRKKKKKKSQIVKIEKEARKNGLHYADIQMQKTLEMVGGVKL